MKGIHLTAAQVEAHQRKHGFMVASACVESGERKRAIPRSTTSRMNNTEREFSLMLQSEKQIDQIARWEFEGITLRWADMRYTPDFVVFPHAYSMSSQIKMIEVKGAHIWDRDIVRFKGARAFWPEFIFEMWQKTKMGWLQKY